MLPEGFPVNPVTLTGIREHARARGLLQAPDTDPVEIVDIEELEMIEGIQQDSGPSMLDILRGKQSGSLRNAAKSPWAQVQSIVCRSATSLRWKGPAAV